MFNLNTPSDLSKTICDKEPRAIPVYVLLLLAIAIVAYSYWVAY